MMLQALDELSNQLRTIIYFTEGKIDDENTIKLVQAFANIKEVIRTEGHKEVN